MTTTIPTIILNENATITHIVHVADIHCKKDKQDHHRLVFAKFYEKLKEHSNTHKNNLLIVICGDLFDALSCEIINLAREFCINLCKIAPVCIQVGNHEMASRNNPNSLDYITTTLSDLKTDHPLHIINKTGNYIYGNIVFGATDLFSNTVATIDPKHKDKIKIGLYHGIINGMKNNLGFSLSNSAKFNISNFNEYDFVFLGDIHVFHYLNRQKTIAYPSSLLQLNHGESIKEHGYILWDLLNKTSKHHHIPNDHGYLTVKIENNKLVDKLMKNLPKNIELKIIQNNSTDKIVRKIKKKISKKTNITKYHIDRTESNYSDIVSLGNNRLITAIKDDNDAKNLLFEYIKNDTKITNDEIEQMKPIMDELLIAAKNKYETEEKHISIKSLTFSNCLSYGANNSIKFGNFKNVILLNGENGVGKSSIIHCLLYAIYGTDQDINGKYEYVNSKKNKMNTCVILDVNNIEYRIERNCNFANKNRNKKNFKQNVSLFKNDENINGLNTVEIEAKIRTEICDITQLLNLCIMTQKKSISFFDLSDEEKKIYICKVFKLDIYNNIVKTAITLSKSLATKIEVKNKLIYANNKNRIETKDIALTENKNTISNELNKLNENISEMTENQKKLCDQKAIYEEKLKNKNITNSNNYNIEQINEILEKNNKILQNKNTIEERNKNFLKNKEDEILIKNNEIIKLSKDYNSLIELIDIKNIKTQKNNIQIELNKNNQERDQLNTENEDYNKQIVIIEKNSEKKYNKLKLILENINTLNQNLKDKEKLLNQQNKYLETLKNHKYNTTCDECMSNNSTKDKIDIENKIKQTTDEIDNLNNNIAELETESNKYKKYKNIPNILNQNITYTNKINENNNKINLLNKTIEMNQMKLNEITEKENKYNANTKTIEKNKDIDEKIQELNKQIETIRNTENIEYNEYINLKTENKKHRNIKKKIQLKTITEEYNKITDNLANLNKDRDNINTKLGEMNNELTTILATIDDKKKLENKKAINDKIIGIIENGFINELLNNKILPKIENSLNNLLKSYVDFKIKLKYENLINADNKKILAYKNDDGFYSLASKLSGYQSVMAAVAFRLVMNQLNMQTKSKFIILDEIFAYNDDNNIMLTKQLFNFMREHYNWVLVITHNDQIKRYTNDEINIERKDGFSYINV
jgi:DNA repair exonuclease SbcCD ATPase subunit